MCQGGLCMCVLVSPHFLPQLHFLLHKPWGKNDTKLITHLVTANFLRWKGAETRKGSSETQRCFKSHSGRLTVKVCSPSPHSCALFPILSCKIHQQPPQPEETTFQVRVSSRNYFLTLALNRALVLAEPSHTGQTNPVRELLAASSEPSRVLTGSCFCNAPLVERNLSIPSALASRR